MAPLNFERREQSLEYPFESAGNDMSEAKKGLAVRGETVSAVGDLGGTAKGTGEVIAQEEDLHHGCMADGIGLLVRDEEQRRGACGACRCQAGLRGCDWRCGGALVQSQSIVVPSVFAFFVDAISGSAVRPGLGEEAYCALACTARLADEFRPAVRGRPVARLEDEAAADADEQAYCDEEMSAAEAKKVVKVAEVEKLTTRV